MVSAGLATGNAVVLKPAEQSPGCALLLFQALREAGVPPDAVSLLPGEGEVGAALVRDPRVHTIAFTGSGQVGLEIVREAAKPWPEADGDVCEAIDFLEYYARGALDLAQGAPLLQVPGERNELHYAPRGVVAVISPWNLSLIHI